MWLAGERMNANDPHDLLITIDAEDVFATTPDLPRHHRPDPGHRWRPRNSDCYVAPFTLRDGTRGQMSMIKLPDLPMTARCPGPGCQHTGRCAGSGPARAAGIEDQSSRRVDRCAGTGRARWPGGRGRPSVPDAKWEPLGGSRRSRTMPATLARHLEFRYRWGAVESTKMIRPVAPAHVAGRRNFGPAGLGRNALADLRRGGVCWQERVASRLAGGAT